MTTPNACQAQNRTPPGMLLGEDSEIREELPQLLAQLEQQGYLERVGETRDGARFPLYRVTSAGVQAAEN